MQYHFTIKFKAVTSPMTPSHQTPANSPGSLRHNRPRWRDAAAGLAAAMLLWAAPEPLGGQEYRAWWVDGWGAGFLNQSQVDTLLGVPGNATNLGTIRQANCNAVIVQVRRRFDTCYPSGVGEPYMSGLSPANFNALAAMIKAAHDTTGGKKRIEVHCWSVVFKTAKGLVYTQHSDPNNPDNYWPTRLGSTTGEENADGAFDPGHPKVLEYLVNAHMDLVNFQTTAGPDGTDGHIDGIHYDYIRFEGNTEGFNPTSVARYNARYGLTGEPLASDEQFKQWRRDQVTAFVRQMYARIQKTKPWIKQSGAFVTWNPSPTASTRAAFRATRPYYDVYSDWDSWVEEGIVDMAVPMTYYNWASLPNDYTRWINFEKDRRFNRHMIIGPGTYLNSLNNAILELQMTRSASPAGNYADGFSGYSYRVPYSGGTWAGFSPSLVAQVTTNWADIPSMPWKTSPTKGHVMGSVAIGATGAWADHAIVTLAGPVNRSTYVDGTGFYAFIDLPPGTYNVTASLNGYSPATATVTVAVGAVTGNMYEQNFALSAGGPPVITAQPQSLTVAQGSNVTFSVSANGTPPFGYQWRFNGADLAGATASSFTRSNVQPAHEGDYTVVITNPVGSVTSAVATLTVIVPPAITTHPQSQTVTQGMNVAFGVAASGTAPFGYLWRFNGNPIAGATQSAFTITNVQPSDAGNYSVIVSNFAATATSANAALTVHPAPVPPSILSEPLDVVAAAGQTVLFTVTASGAQPLAYQWRLNHADLPGATANQLLLPGIQTNQAGGYSVLITNAYGAVTSRTAQLTVTPAFVAIGLKQLWSLAPGSRSYLTFSSPPNERGLAYNPLNRHLILVNRTAPSVHVLDADTGADLWTLNTSGIAGGYSSSYYLLMVGVADDGVVYAGNLTLNGTTTPFKLYRWANDNPGTAPTVAYAGDPGNGTAYRWGDTLDVRGSGPNTQIILSSRAGNTVAILTTSDGLTFTSKLVVVADAPAGAFGLGTAFGAGNTFWGKATSQNLRQVAFDLASGTGVTVRNHPAPDFPATVAPIGVSTAFNLLGGINVGVTGNDFRLFDLTLDGSTPQFIASTNFATDNDNTYSGTGAVDFGGDRVYALGSGNGIIAMQIIPATPAQVAPVILFQPEPQTVKWTSNATFTVVASGTEPLAYQWQFNSTSIPGATASSYTRPNAQYSDAGLYQVQITNVAGAVTSQPAMLTVLPPQPVRFEEIKALPDGRIQLLWSGEPGWSYTLQTTTNADFLDWWDRGPISGSNGWFDFVDDEAVNSPQRFYRTRQ
ncbi:MAG TPA: immunoglobulin domain-containing protein [Candidatus Paceibacterota bacterium]|nr:immunoglobulin domain-containing protein [Candidatus Paceibacterota bacterium]